MFVLMFWGGVGAPIFGVFALWFVVISAKGWQGVEP